VTNTTNTKNKAANPEEIAGAEDTVEVEVVWATKSDPQLKVTYRYLKILVSVVNPQLSVLELELTRTLNSSSHSRSLLHKLKVLQLELSRTRTPISSSVVNPSSLDTKAKIDSEKQRF